MAPSTANIASLILIVEHAHVIDSLAGGHAFSGGVPYEFILHISKSMRLVHVRWLYPELKESL